MKVLDLRTCTTALPHIIRNLRFIVTSIDNLLDYWLSGNQVINPKMINVEESHKLKK